MNCWKCGAKTDGVMECEACEAATFAAATKTPAAQPGQVVHVIDWDKVQTFEELKEILTAFGFQVPGGPGTEPYDKLRRFLKGIDS
jgi:hypothetical protein